MIDRIRQGLVAVENVHQKDASVLVKRARDPDCQRNANCQIEQVSSYFDVHNWSPWKLNTFNSCSIRQPKRACQGVFERVQKWSFGRKLLLNGLRALFAALPQRIVHVELTGARSKGEELNVKTTNGGVNIETPNNYSAHLKRSEEHTSELQSRGHL